MSKSKVVTAEAAVSHIASGMTVMIPGFVKTGVPTTLIDALLTTDKSDFNLISGDASSPGWGLGLLIDGKRVRHITCTHIGANKAAVEKVVSGDLDVSFVPQGTMAERIRAGGAGLGGVLTPTGLGTHVADGKRIISVDGKDYILETPLRADVALIHAWKADKIGNCVFRRTSRNWNSVMATAADWVIVEAEHIVETGELDPDSIMTPGCLVDHVVQGRPTE